MELVEPPPKSTTPRKPPPKPKQVDPRKLVEALTPIRETTFEEYDEESNREKMESQSEQVIKMMNVAHKEKQQPYVSIVMVLW